MSDSARLIEEMRWQLKRIEDRRAENQRLIAASEHTRVVTVLAGPGGIVSEVRLAPEAMRLDAETLGRTITAAIREAATGRAASPRRPVAADDDEPYDTVYDV